MLSLSPLRSANQQSTSVLDSLVSWASWSAARQSSVNRISYATSKDSFFKPGIAFSFSLQNENGLIKNIYAIPVMLAPSREQLVLVRVIKLHTAKL